MDEILRNEVAQYLLTSREVVMNEMRSFGANGIDQNSWITRSSSSRGRVDSEVDMRIVPRMRVAVS